MARLGVPIVVLLGCLPMVFAFYSSGGPVVELTPSNFQSKIKSGGIWLVEFYAPWCGHCKNLIPAWQEAAGALKGVVNVAAVDADQHKSLAGEYQVQGFPTIKVLYADDKGQIKAEDYQGGRTAKDIASYGLDKAKSYVMKKLGAKSTGGSKPSGSAGGKKAGGGGDAGGFYGAGSSVVALSDGDFEDEVLSSNDLWFVEFYAPWCGHCKQLKPAWEDAAEQLSGKVKVGAVDCTAHQGVCQQFDVKGYPTIKFFGTNKRKPQDYNGDRSSGGIVAFATEQWAKNAPAPEVHELTSQDTFDRECLEPSSGTKQLCFLAFLPDILDSKASGRNAYIKTLKKLAEEYKDRPFGYLWTQGAVQTALEKNLDVGGFGYPALVAITPGNKKYSTCRTAFEFDHIKGWVEKLRKGQEVAAPIQGTLAEVKTVNPWDGKDAVVAEEEEFDLNDIMNEEL